MRRLTMPFTWLARRPAIRGVLAGVLLVFAVREVINHTYWADRLVAPLGRPDTGGQADAMVVLGAGATALCTPNMFGIQRVMLAARLFREGRAPLVVITGGRSAGSGCSVAEAMRTLALDLGIPDERIRLETESTSTWLNAVRSDAVLKTLGATSILLVTDRTHMGRAEASFRRFGYRIERAGVPIQLGHADNVSVLGMGLREYAATAYYRLRGYISETPEEGAKVVRVEPARGWEMVKSESMNAGGPSPPSRPVVMLGASYAKSWRPALPAGVPLVNKGVAGEQSFEMLQRFDADVVQQGARAVVLWGFINDVFRAPRPELDTALARVRESYLAMLERSREHGITPIIATEITMGPRAGLMEATMMLAGQILGRPSYMDYVNRHVIDTNAWLRELARSRGLLLLDLQPALSTSTGARRRSYTAADGSHITEAGYEALSRYAEPVLRQALDGPAATP